MTANDKKDRSQKVLYKIQMSSPRGAQKRSQVEGKGIFSSFILTYFDKLSERLKLTKKLDRSNAADSEKTERDKKTLQKQCSGQSFQRCEEIDLRKSKMQRKQRS